MLMKRAIMQKLLAWKSNPKRKPLILQGVRQTGKTYILTQFGHEHFEHVHIINFEKQISLQALFKEDLDPKRILDDLCFQVNTKINIHTDLVIFDEIQECPQALTSLKYFCEDLPELALCCAGSLLGLHLNEASYPVGKVDLLQLHPMTFTEFLEGIGDQQAADFINEFQITTKVSAIKHKHLWDRLKQYFITGGLPEVITIFDETQNDIYTATIEVRRKQEELIKAYYADIAKYSGKVNAMHIDRTWRSVPIQLAKNYDVSTSRFRFKEILPNIKRYRQLVNVIDWLEAAELVIKIPIVGPFEQPINAYTKDNLFKLMLFDIGLLGAMNSIDPNSILDYDYGTYKGYFAENFVAQQLLTTDTNRLFNWQEDRSEIEFLMTYAGEVLPVEVKSGKTTRTKSLEKYINKYKPKNAIILSANPPNINKSKTVSHISLYLVEKIIDILF